MCIRDSIDLLTQLLAAAEAKARNGSIIKILMVLALARAAQENLPAAIDALERALILAEPEGYVRIFAECGIPMRQLLQEAMTRSITPTYTHQLLTTLDTWGQPQADLPTTSDAPTTSVMPVPQALIEPLSQRELDVLLSLIHI